MSGWIAYGVARQLENQGAEIELLVVIDAWAPAYWADQPPLRKRLMRAIYEMQRSRWIGRRFRRTGASTSGTPIQRAFDRFTAAAQKAMARLSRQRPTEAQETEEMRRLGQLQRTASRAALTGPLQGNVILFRSEEEPTGPMLAPDMGWGKVLGRNVQVEVLPGDHHQIFELPGARMMAIRAREVLGTASPSFPAPEIAANAGALKSAGRNIPLVEA